MKKILITIVGLLLMVTYGCSSDDAKKAEEKTKEVVIETKDTAVTATKEAVTATKEAATTAKDKTVEMGQDAVKTTKKKGTVEGC